MSLNDKLILAIESQNLYDVKKILERGENVDIHYKDDLAIVRAAEVGNLDIIKYLVEKGADVNAQSGAPMTASVDGGHLDNVKYLIENGADLKINEYSDLYLAAERGNIDMIKYFIEEERSIESHAKYIKILEGIFMEAIRNINDDIIRYMVENQVDIHTEDDVAMFLAIKNFDQVTVYYLIEQAEIQGVPYSTETLVRLRTDAEDRLFSPLYTSKLRRLFPWGQSEEADTEADTEAAAEADHEDYYERSAENYYEREAEAEYDRGSLYDESDSFVDDWASPVLEEGQDEETGGDSEYEEDNQIDPGYAYKSDDESIDDSVELNPGENEKDKIKSICINETSVITLEEYDKLDDMYTIYRKKRNDEFFKKGECGTKSELRDYLNSDKDQEIPSFFMTIGTTPKLKRDLITGFTSKPTGKIVVRLPNDMYVTLKSVQRILSSKDHSNWFALPLYNGKPRRIVNLRGFYGIGNNHGQVPGFVVYKLFTGTEIKNKVIVQESTADFPSLYLHNMMEPLFDILEVYNLPIEKFINNLIDYTTK
jgi:hypothetical protein